MKTYDDVAAAFPQFTEQEIGLLKQAMDYTWNSIGADVEPYMEDPFDDAHIVELIVDGGRMKNYGVGYFLSPEHDARKAAIDKFYDTIRTDHNLYPALPEAIWGSRRARRS